MGWDIPFRSLCALIEGRGPRDMVQYRGASWRQEPIWSSVREREFILLSLEAKIIQKFEQQEGVPVEGTKPR